MVTSLETVQRRSIVWDFFSGARTLVSSPSGRMLPSQIISGLDYIKSVDGFSREPFALLTSSTVALLADSCSTGVCP